MYTAVVLNHHTHRSTESTKHKLATNIRSYIAKRKNRERRQVARRKTHISSFCFFIQECTSHLHLIFAKSKGSSHVHEFEKICELVAFVCFGRGTTGDGAAAQIPLARSKLPLPIERLSRKIDISSTEIRTRVAKGLPIQYLVPESVRLLIQSHALYIQPV